MDFEDMSRKIYMIVGSKQCAVLSLAEADTINKDTMGDVMGTPVTIHEIGIAHEATPPGTLLMGHSVAVTRRRPLGKIVT